MPFWEGGSRCCSAGAECCGSQEGFQATGSAAPAPKAGSSKARRHQKLGRASERTQIYLHRLSFPLLFSVLLLLAVGQGCTYPKGLTGSPSERTSEPELREGFLPVTLKRTASFDSCRQRQAGSSPRCCRSQNQTPCALPAAQLSLKAAAALGQTTAAATAG